MFKWGFCGGIIWVSLIKVFVFVNLERNHLPIHLHQGEAVFGFTRPLCTLCLLQDCANTPTWKLKKIRWTMRQQQGKTHDCIFFYLNGL